MFRKVYENVSFQSTLPLRGATYVHFSVCGKMYISIHAPLTGSDNSLTYRAYGEKDFNPRSPYGERPGAGGKRPYVEKISIHAPLTGSD